MTSNQATQRSHGRSVLRPVLLGLGFTAIVVILLLWLAGTFEEKVEAGRGAEPQTVRRPIPDGAQLVSVRQARIPRMEAAVGTIRAVHETAVASKILAKVEMIDIQAGQNVERGDVLARLDDEDLQARVRQAEAALQAAQAARGQAQVEFERVDRLYQQQNATNLEWERAKTALETARADVRRAEEALNEARTQLGYAVIRSPITGRVVDNLVEAGDTVSPGQIVATLYDPDRMQLVARVREALTRRLEVGQQIGVEIDALGLKCHGEISEIVPEAEAASRSFSVKVTGPCPAGVYSGMFGRMLIPLDQETVLLIPRAAVRHVGQLNLVNVAVAPDGAPKSMRRRAVQLGEVRGEEVEVLAGLRPDEQVVLTTGAEGDA